MSYDFLAHSCAQNIAQDSKYARILARWGVALLLTIGLSFAHANTAAQVSSDQQPRLLDTSARGLPSVVPQRSNQLIYCLAQEELIIHEKKFGGALYRLNQTLINELVSWNDIHLLPNYTNRVCQDRPFSPSINLLRLALLNGKEVFDLDFSNEQDGVIVYQIQEITSFIDRLPKILFSYLADLQILVDNPHCFNNAIPEYSYFLERFQYLEVHLSVSSLIEEKDKLEAIFERLKNIDTIIKGCKNQE